MRKLLILLALLVLLAVGGAGAYLWFQGGGFPGTTEEKPAVPEEFKDPRVLEEDEEDLLGTPFKRCFLDQTSQTEFCHAPTFISVIDRLEWGEAAFRLGLFFEPGPEEIPIAVTSETVLGKEIAKGEPLVEARFSEIREGQKVKVTYKIEKGEIVAMELTILKE